MWKPGLLDLRPKLERIEKLSQECVMQLDNFVYEGAQQFRGKYTRRSAHNYQSAGQKAPRSSSRGSIFEPEKRAPCLESEENACFNARLYRKKRKEGDGRLFFGDEMGRARKLCSSSTLMLDAIISLRAR